MKKKNSNIYQKLEGLKAPIDKESMWSEIQQYTKQTPIVTKWYQLSYKNLLMGVPIVTISTLLLVLSIQNEDAQIISTTKSISTSQSIENSESIISENSINKDGLNQKSKNNNSSISKIDNTSKHNEESFLTSKIESENRIDSLQTMLSTIPNSKSNVPINSSDEVKNDNNSRSALASKIRGLQGQEVVFTESIHKGTQKVDFQNKSSIQSDVSKNQNNKLTESKSNEISRIYEEEVSGIDNRWTSNIPYKYMLANPKFILNLPTQTSNWSLGVRLGLGYGNISRSYSAVETDNWTKTLLENTKPVQSYHLDLFLQRKVYKNWSLRLGVDYSRYNDRLSYVDSEITYQRNNLGSDQSLFTSENITTNYKLFHRYSFINLSLSVSRPFNWRSWTLIPSLGIVYNQQFSQNGNTLDEQLTTIPLGSVYQYAKSIPLRYQAGVSFQRSYSKYVSMDINFMYKPSTTITNVDNSFQLTAGGLSAGIGFHYNW